MNHHSFRGFVIGVSDYSQLTSLDHADSDAQDFAKWLVSLPGYDPANVELFASRPRSDRERKPTLTLLREALTRVAALPAPSPSDYIYFFFSGHGCRSADGDDLLCPMDTDPSRLKDTTISVREIAQVLCDTGVSNVILFLDACRNRTAKVKGPVLAQFGNQTEEIVRQHGIVTFFSCSPGQTSWESRELKRGLFTHTLQAVALSSGARISVYDLDGLLCEALPRLVEKLAISGAQTPYTVTAPMAKGRLPLRPDGDTSAGKTPEVRPDRGRRDVVVVGPSNAGKSTLGRLLKRDYGYTHVELSDYVWRRYKAELAMEFPRTVLEFVDHMWSEQGRDVLARDLIDEEGVCLSRRLVVCGPRAVEEVDFLTARLTNPIVIGIHAHQGIRYIRSISRGRASDPGDPDKFLDKDYQELSWGIAKLMTRAGVHRLCNEGSISDYNESVRALLVENKAVDN